jgi:phosphatidylcholine synthase
VLKPGPLATAAAVVALAALTFVPFHVVHPMRIRHLREVTLFALVVWALLAIYAVATDLAPGFWAQAGLCLLGVYFVAVGFLRRHHP